jgi:hypothetical protein
MSKVAAFLFLAVGLAACGMIGTLVDGYKYAKAVENELEISTGIKPQVGFNWRNGRLVTVTVAFPQLYEAKPLRELAETVRRAVTSQFKQVPNDIQLVFSLGKTAPGTAAQLHEPPENLDRKAL